MRNGNPIEERYASHSPEPWIVGCARNRPGAWNDIEAPGLEWRERKIALIPCDDPRYAANQRLIVATPRLLSRSKALVVSALQLPPCAPGMVSIDLDLLRALLAEIDKAEGKV